MIDDWGVSFRGISVWGYFRNYANNSRVTSYNPKFCFSIYDFIGFLKFIMLPFTKRKVVFVCGRKDVIDFVNGYFDKGGYVLFIRNEKVRGNVFFIESLRHIFRVVAPLLCIKEKKQLINILSDILPQDVGKVKGLVNHVIGDYFFNKFVSFFISNKDVYYTNCVVPKIERYMGIMNSCEIQHGVIYKGHLDYTDIPEVYIKNKLLLWSREWSSVIEECGYGGRVIYGEYNREGFFEDEGFSEIFDIIIYSTVSDEFSKKVEEIYNKHGCLCNIVIQKHPRDYYKYSVPKGVFKDHISPKFAKDIVVNDSTLIISFVMMGLFFYYLPTDKEDRSEIKTRLFSKYGAVEGEHYCIGVGNYEVD